MTEGILTDEAAPDTQRAAGSKRDLWLCWWTTIVFYTLFGIIFVPLTRIMPPPGPGMSVPEVNRFFDDYATTIQIGFVLLLLVIGLGSIANGLVAYQMARMSVSKLYAYGYIVTLAVGALPGCLFAAFMFLLAVFRPDTDPEMVALLYDVAFLTFVGSLGCFTTNYALFAVAVLLDKNEIFPKWLAYVAVWQIVTELLAAPVFIFRDGPFSWNGVIAFWEGTVLFGVFLAALIMLTRKAIEQQPAGEKTGGL